jgi:hypothetical protein
MENTEAVNPPGWNNQVEDDPLKTSEFRRSVNRFADKNMRHSELQGEAQPGRAPASDAGGRRFESCHPDQFACLAQRQSPRLISAVVRVRLSGHAPTTEAAHPTAQPRRRVAQPERAHGSEP